MKGHVAVTVLLLKHSMTYLALARAGLGVTISGSYTYPDDHNAAHN